jgi:hypothetical protein
MTWKGENKNKVMTKYEKIIQNRIQDLKKYLYIFSKTKIPF